MEPKKDYINRIYNEARMQGLCSKQGEFAELLGMNPSTISKALQGDERYLTDNFIRRVQIWEKQVLNSAPRVEKPSRPDIVIPAATAELYNNMSETIRVQAEIIARLQSGIVGALPGAYAPKNFQTDGK